MSLIKPISRRSIIRGAGAAFIIPRPALAQFLGGAATGAGPSRPLRIVANLTRGMYSSSAASSAADQLREARATHFLGGSDVTEIWLAYGNYWLDIGAGGTEVPMGNVVMLGSALEANGVTVLALNAGAGGIYYPMPNFMGIFLAGPFFPASFGLSVFPASMAFFSRTSMYANNIGEFTPTSGMTLSTIPASKRAGTIASSQLAATGVFSDPSAVNVGTPIAVLGRSVTNEISVVTINDSIGEGFGDNGAYPQSPLASGGGWIERGFANVNARNIPVAQLGRQGGQVSRFTTGGSQRRLMYAFATHLILAFGANDLFFSTAQNNYTIFQNNMLTEIARARAQGIRFIFTPHITPRTNSSDSFTTQVNQTPQGTPGVSGYWDPTQVAIINTWIDSLVTAGTIDGTIDSNIYAGNAGQNINWVTAAANNVAFYGTIDGTHPSPLVYGNWGTGLNGLASSWPVYA